MTLRKKELINLPVYTQSGQHLGKVSDFELEPETHVVIKYYIRGGNPIKELLVKELIVSKEQVISITKEKMVVEDSLTTVKSEVVKETAPAN